jgi:hypothetical protein
MGKAYAKAGKLIGDAPSLLREVAEGPAQQAAKNTNLVRDPFFKVVRPKGLSMSEVDAGKKAGKFISEMPSADSSMGQKAAQIAVKGMDTVSDMASKGTKIAGKILPATAHTLADWVGHLPGMALRATAKIMESPKAQQITIGTAKIAKDAAGNIIMNPEGAGLLMNATRQIKQDEEQE